MGEKASNYLLYFSSEQLPGCNFDSVDRISNLRYGIVCPYIDSIPGATRWGKVWSLTQFYYVEFSKSRIDVKKCIFNKRTIKVCVSCCRRCPETSALSVPHLTVSLYLCSSGSNARGESRAREGRRVSSKSPSRVRDRDEGVVGRNGRE